MKSNPVLHFFSLLFISTSPFSQNVSTENNSSGSSDTIINAEEDYDESDTAVLLDSIPKIIKFIKADYPETLISTGIEGSVLLDILINERGTVDSASVISSLHPTLDSLAIKAASEFIFSPGIAGGQPVPVNITFEYKFSLSEIIDKISEYINITGKVIEKGTRKPVSGASILLTFLTDGVGKANEKEVNTVILGNSKIPVDKYLQKIGSFKRQSYENGQITTNTDSAGIFNFSSVPPGKVALKVISFGYEPLYDTVDVYANEKIEFLYRLKKTSYDEFEIVVYGKQENKEISRKNLKAQQAKRIAGFDGDVVKAVQAYPGIARPSTYNDEVIIRGADWDDNRYFINGIEVPYLWHSFGNKSVVNPSIIDNIDLYTSGFGVQYNNVLGGVVNIKTRKGRADHFHCIIDQSLFQSSIVLEFPVSNKFSFIGSARRDFLMAFINWFDEEFLENNPYYTGYYWDYSLRLDYVPNKNHSFYCNYISAKDTMYQIMYRESDEGERSGKSFSILSGGWDWEISDKFKNEFTYGVGPISEKRNEKFTIFDGNWTISGYRYTIRNNLQFKPSGKISTQLGLDIQLEPIKYKYRGQYSYWLNFERIDTVYDYGFEELFGSVGGFISCEIKPTKKLTIIPQYRLDYYPELHYKGSLIPELWDYKSKKGKFQWSYEPSFRLSTRYSLIPGHNLKGAFGTYNLSPKYMAVNDYGNPLLEPARGAQYSLGYEWQISDLLSFDMQGYLNRQWDKAQVLWGKELKDDEELRYENRGKARMKGLEFFLKHEQGSRFFGWVNYTLAYSERYDYKEREWVVFDRNILNNFQLVASYNLPKNMNIGLRFQYTDGYPYTPVKRVLYYDASNFRYMPEYGKKNSDKFTPFIGLDFRFEKKCILKRSILTIYAGCDRILHFLQLIEKDDGTPVYFPAEEPTYNYDFTRFQGETAYPGLSIGFSQEF